MHFEEELLHENLNMRGRKPTNRQTARTVQERAGAREVNLKADRVPTDI